MSFQSFLEKKGGRETPVSWEPLITNILDGYLNYIDDLAHAVQKDAIQNSWDAKVDWDRWRMFFNLLTDSNGKTMLIMEDQGTTGLTGRILPREEYDGDLSEYERWGRFQGLAFQRMDPKAIGARGQGKFVFVGNSETRTLVYDTFRDDGIYRLGVRKAGKIYEYEGDEASKVLKAYSDELKPLSKIGTRVIIDEPVEALKEAIRSKRFIRYIQTTWWPILLEHKAKIIVRWDKEEQVVDYPKDLQFPESDTDSLKIWYREWVKIGKSHTGIKKLKLVWSEEHIEEDIKGIAVLRGGMVVEQIPIWELLPGMETELIEKIYGYVEPDLGLELFLKNLEDPTHYKFRRRGGWGHKNLFGILMEYLTSELQRFATEKLGMRKGQKATDDASTLQIFNTLAESLKIPVISTTPVPNPPEPDELDIKTKPDDKKEKPVTKKDLDLIVPPPRFINPRRRVDYGEEISDIRFTAINRTDSQADVKITICTDQEGILRDAVFDLEINIPPKSEHSEEARSLTINGKYAPGKCYLRGTLICLGHKDYEKGTELDKTAYVFWIEEDPPSTGRGPFREIERLPEVIDRILNKDIPIDSRVTPHPDGGYTLVVNLGHPLYRTRCKKRDDEPEYLIDLMAKNLSHVLIAQDHETFQGIEDPIEIARRSCAIHSFIMGQYYAGRS